YGLTKGQYSPTSELGKVTKSTPAGSVDYPFNPIAVAMGVDSTFVARAIDVDVKTLQDLLRRAHEHPGGAFIEILQNCNIFNDGAWDHLTDKATKADNVLLLEHGKPLLFGQSREKGIRFGPAGRLEVVTLGQDVGVDDVLVHDERNRALAYMLAHLERPTPIGIFHASARPAYEEAMAEQIATARTKGGSPDMNALFSRGETWTVD
ncbi:MAG TPA: thiamine pyrophosphate-dependent enzyme, partial [Candidatus Sulfotelmatobacter sp.]|nr:thiamine pyrophosphate-dependent enzyme [Candidatus Sulfotelmatobacter sp.]